ncbi:nicotinate-nucleotide adenylyltransferase [Bacteroidota bacterium]
MKPVGIFGGTFDPVHNGHLIAAQSVLELRNLEKIIFIPCYISPHKQDIVSSSAAHRIEILNLATGDNPNYEISDYEIKKKSVSYTVDTVEELKKIYDKIELIIGYDNLITFDKWYESDKLLELCSVVVMKRSTDLLIDLKHKYFEMVEYVDTPTIEISSREIRDRVKRNLTISNLVPDKVKEYISLNKLYK